jgi:hypothetical protein
VVVGLHIQQNWKWAALPRHCVSSRLPRRFPRDLDQASRGMGEGGGMSIRRHGHRGGWEPGWAS